jgi:hypothetical protein
MALRTKKKIDNENRILYKVNKLILPYGSIFFEMKNPTISVCGIYENQGVDSSLVELYLIKKVIVFNKK